MRWYEHESLMCWSPKLCNKCLYAINCLKIYSAYIWLKTKQKNTYKREIFNGKMITRSIYILTQQCYLFFVWLYARQLQWKKTCVLDSEDSSHCKHKIIQKFWKKLTWNPIVGAVIRKINYQKIYSELIYQILS